MANNITVRHAEPEDLFHFHRIMSVCFEYPFTYKGCAEEFYKEASANAAAANDMAGVHFMEKYIAASDGEVIAGMCALPYKIAFDGGDMRMCGIGGVCTLPPYRRLGAVRSMIGAMLRAEYEKGTEWSFLYPFSQSYYEQFGYALSEPEVVWSFSLRHIARLKNDGYSFSLYGGGDAGLEDFRIAYEGMPDYNMLIRRSRCDYAKIIGANPYTGNDFAYICRDHEGRPCGYAVWHKEHEEGRSVMRMTELVFDDERTLGALIKFAAGFASDYEIVRFNAPALLNLEYLCADYTAGRLQRNVVPCGMARVIHLENALKGARFLGTGEVSLSVVDTALDKWHRMGLRWHDGKLADMGATLRPPDAELSIGAFSALLLGRFGQSDFSFIAGAYFNAPEKFTGLFYKKPIHIKNFF